MAKAGSMYPQVEPRAAALMDRRVVTVPASRRVADALRTALRTESALVVLGAGRAVRRRELERAVEWGLGAWDVTGVSWEGLPTVSEDAPEIVVRRLVLGGVPMILVRSGRAIVGVVDAARIEVARPTQSVVERLDRLEHEDADARVWLLRVAGKAGEAL